MSRPVKPLKVQPLWARVDQNRVKLAIFVVLFVVGSAALITAALVALPALLIGWFGGFYFEWWSPGVWVDPVVKLILIGFGLLILIGAFIAAVQLSNAEDWVRNRFGGSELDETAATGLSAVVSDMSIAAGLSVRPRLLLLEAEPDAVNAFALGTSRKQPVIGVTPGFLSKLTLDEQRAVIATLAARIARGDIWFSTALAALMGPLKAIREARLSGDSAGAIAEGCGGGCSNADLSGCGNGCGDGCVDLGDLDEGCAGAVAVIVFFVVVAALTYAAVISAAWIVTLWGRALHRTAYEKADAEGMLLLKDPAPMLSALRRVSRSFTAVGTGDASYDGIFYAATSGTPRVEKVEARRFARLREVLGTEGVAAQPLDESPPDERYSVEPYLQRPSSEKMSDPKPPPSPPPDLPSDEYPFYEESAPAEVEAAAEHPENPSLVESPARYPAELSAEEWPPPQSQPVGESSPPEVSSEESYFDE